jgi:two-component system cell cycle sensor histidine kinase/response regulator CckA
MGSDTMQDEPAGEARDAEARYRALTEGALCGILQLSADGRLRAANPALVRMLGYPTEAELLAIDPAAALFRDPAGHARLVERCRRGRMEGFETEWQRRDGQLITVRLSGRALRRARGTPDGFEALVEDVSERWLLQHQLRQAQKMEVVGRLAGGVAHDFNNLLAVVTGYSEILMLNLPAGEPLHEYAEEIRKAAERAAALTRQLLNFGRKQARSLQVVDLNMTLAGIKSMLQRLIGADVELVLRPGAGLGWVEADPAQIDQVLMNLAVNARDAMPEGGRLTIETANVELGEIYARRHIGARPGSYVMLAVSDTGCGMDREVQAQIFEPFFTTKEPGKGTGLGLAVIYGIVNQSGGDVEVESDLGRGTTFRIYLPRVEAAARPVPPPAAGDAAGGSETILLAEDEPGVRGLLRAILEMNGYRVLEATNGIDALALLEQHTGPVHLLIADRVMPGLGGRELAERIAARYPEMKVLYISGYAGPEVVRSGLLETDATFLQKPFTPEQLARTVRQVLDGE